MPPSPLLHWAWSISARKALIFQFNSSIAENFDSTLILDNNKSIATEINTIENSQEKSGYAKEQSSEKNKSTADFLHPSIIQSDCVITTAMIPGKKSPILINKNSVENMKKGSVIIDLAAERGGNCELTEPGKVSTKHGVIIDGTTNIPGTMSVHATELYAKNVNALLTHIYSSEDLSLNMEDEITEGSLYLYNGEIVDDRTKEALS